MNHLTVWGLILCQKLFSVWTPLYSDSVLWEYSDISCHEKMSQHLFSVLSLGYIDLSKRRVSPEEAIKCEDKFTKSKTVSQIIPKYLFCRQHIAFLCMSGWLKRVFPRVDEHELTRVFVNLTFWRVLLYLQVYSILRHVAEVLEYTKDEQLESLYQRTAWVFDEKYKRPGYGAYDVFKQAVS